MGWKLKCLWAILLLFMLEIPALKSEQQHLLTQKSSQLEASLETASKFKFYFHQEKDKTDTLEQSIARLR